MRAKIAETFLRISVPDDVRVGDKLEFTGRVVVSAIESDLIDAGHGEVIPGETTCTMLVYIVDVRKPLT